jgi:hypothetical protein
VDEALTSASLLAASAAESLGLHRRSMTGGDLPSGEGPNPFQTLSSRFP